MTPPKKTKRSIVAVVGLALVLSLTTNAMREARLPLISPTPHETFVPCPGRGNLPDTLQANELRERPGEYLIIDAREPDEFHKEHFANSISVPFDYLEFVPFKTIKTVAATGARKIAIYGDGDNPDSGKELGRELSYRGIRNLHVVPGGWPALRLGNSE